MADVFTSIGYDTRPLTPLSRAQVGLILGLEPILREMGAVLTCPRCALNGHPELETANSAEDEIWKIDCKCRRRRTARIGSRMTPTGWLLQMVAELLPEVSLDVRCLRCLLTPLSLHLSQDGQTLTARCKCREYRFRKTRPQTSH